MAHTSSLLDLNEDELLMCFMHAATGIGAHAQAARLACVCSQLRSLVNERLWLELCQAPEFGPVAACAPAGDWKMLHRALTVPIKSRTRSWKSWHMRERMLAGAGFEREPTFRLTLAPSAAPPKSCLGFARWRPASLLLREEDVLCKPIHSPPLDKSTDAVGTGSAEETARAHQIPHWCPMEELTGSGRELHAIAREASSNYCLLFGIIAPLDARASALLRQNERRSGCLFCERQPRWLASGRACSRRGSAPMYAATSWFKRCVTLPRGGLSKAGVCAELMRADMCEQGHVVLQYEGMFGASVQMRVLEAAGSGESDGEVEENEADEDVGEDLIVGEEVPAFWNWAADATSEGEGSDDSDNLTEYEFEFEDWDEEEEDEDERRRAERIRNTRLHSSKKKNRAAAEAFRSVANFLY